MPEEEKKEGRGFKVEDRRRFSPQGEARPEGPAAPGGAEKTASAGADPDEPEGEPLPEINFSTFLISLSTQALLHLGEIQNPLTGKLESDIPVAKQMIDIIALLREKTRGNLDRGEAKLIEDVLYDLRMRYVEAVKKK